MRILLEALGIDRPGGGRSATLNLLNGLLEFDHENHYLVILSSRERLRSTPDSRVRQLVLPVANRFAARLAADALLPAIARRFGADLLHHAKNLMTISAPCRRVVTIYDLTILVHPGLFPATDVWYWRHVQPRMLRRAERLIAISETTAADLTAHYGLRPPQVQVVYPSIDPAYSPSAEAAWETLSRYGLDPGYILHVGSISRKKNLLPLVRAIHRLLMEGWEKPLVLVGRVYEKGRDEALFEYVRRERLEGRVIFTGAVPQADLVDLYRSAAVCVFPSVHEGFGLVPVEAMACGVPVLASDGGALAEVVRDAAWLLRGRDDVQEIAEALKAVACDPQVRRRLIHAGAERASHFSPERLVRETLATYRDAVAVR